MEKALGLLSGSTSNINFRNLIKTITDIQDLNESDFVADCLLEVSALDTEEIEQHCKSICPLNDILENGKIHAKDSYKMIALYLMAQLQSSPSQVYNPPSCPSSAEADLTPGTELLFDFAVFHPFMYKCNNRNKTVMRKTHNVVLLGSNPLRMLCDKIICNEMYQEVYHELSDESTIEFGPVMWQLYKSRMLYIGNTFYIDDADNLREDYSVPIKKWSEACEHLNFGETQSMCDKTCLDLNARIGHPYLYQHLGLCEHIVQIECVRLISKYDCLRRSRYPMSLNEHKYNAQNCISCNDVATWIVVNNERLPTNLSPSCHRCFRDFNYSEDGRKIGNFEAIRIIPIPPTDDKSSVDIEL